MAHYLTERPGGERTYLSLVGTRGRMRHHPLELALAEGAELPVPDPFPHGLGHVLVHADIGVYVFVADPLSGPPGWDTLNALVDADPGGVGMARFELRADDQARQHYGSPPPQWGPSEDLVNRVLGEEDPSLREALRFVLGIPRPGEHHRCGTGPARRPRRPRPPVRLRRRTPAPGASGPGPAPVRPGSRKGPGLHPRAAPGRGHASSPANGRPRWSTCCSVPAPPAAAPRAHGATFLLRLAGVLLAVVVRWRVRGAAAGGAGTEQHVD
ncbi:hypothetical protein PV518_39940, partial [Streptomyces sp. ND04-05B]|nr:hypothetical protein [Streptomyces sp. ND04-05B]